MWTPHPGQRQRGCDGSDGGGAEEKWWRKVGEELERRHRVPFLSRLRRFSRLKDLDGLF
jgi:hypothetical protein